MNTAVYDLRLNNTQNRSYPARPVEAAPEPSAEPEALPAALLEAFDWMGRNSREFPPFPV